MDRTPSVAITLGQSEPGSDGNEGVLRIPQSSSITGTLLSVCLISYPRHSLQGVSVGVFYSPSRLSKFQFSDIPRSPHFGLNSYMVYSQLILTFTNWEDSFLSSLLYYLTKVKLFSLNGLVKKHIFFKSLLLKK